MPPIASSPSSNRAWAEIELEALRHNFAMLQKEVGEGTKILSVLKANAYGHGALECAKELVAAGASAIGVANLDEGLALCGLGAQVVVLGALLDEEIAAAIDAGIEFCVYSIESIEIAAKLARRARQKARIHLMIDTGMGRIGITHLETPLALEAIKARASDLELVGISTHFSSAGEADRAFSEQQIERFAMAQRCATFLGVKNLMAHAASHTALLRFPEARFNAVRPGLALFGLQLAGPEFDLGLKRVLSLRASVLHVKEVDAGTPVSYSRLWVAPRRSKIATISIGYNDGIRVGLTGKASVLVGGVRCPIVGRVTMDYVMADVSEVPEVKRGDVATLIGRDGGEEIRLEELSDALGTVPYELTCGLGARVGRRMIGARIQSAETPLRLVA